MSEIEGVLKSLVQESSALLVVAYRDQGAGLQRFASYPPTPSLREESLAETLFRPEALIRDQQRRHHAEFIDEKDPYINKSVAQSLGVRSAALFWFVSDGRPVVIAVGFDQALPSKAVPDVGELAAQCVLALRNRWPSKFHATTTQILHELSRDLEEEPDFGRFLQLLTSRVHHLLNRPSRQAHTSIWLINHVRQELHCEHVFLGRDSAGPKEILEHRSIDTGLIGWMVRNWRNYPRCVVNVEVPDSDDILPDGTPVRDVFIRWMSRNDPSRSELTLPLIYHQRLVGVLNLESPEPSRYEEEVVRTAQTVATHLAQAIHQRELDELHRELIKANSLDDLTQAIVEQTSRFVEAPHATLYLWSEIDRALVLKAAPNEVRRADNGELIPPGTLAYRDRGIGLTRWSFDHGLSLFVNDADQLQNPHDSPEYQRVLESSKIEEQIRKQLAARCTPSCPLDAIELRQTDKPGDDRRFWRVLYRGSGGRPANLPAEIPCPVWSRTQIEGDGNQSQTVLIVPIPSSRAFQQLADPRSQPTTSIRRVRNPAPPEEPSRPALGVLRFVRRSASVQFNDFEAELLNGIAIQCARLIAYEQLAEARLLAQKALAEIVKKKPGHWHEGFQERLEGLLQEVSRSLGADGMIIRHRRGNDLSLEACHCTFGLDATMVIPKNTRLWIGGSGLAAGYNDTIYIKRYDHPIYQSARSEVKERPEEAFVGRLHSEVAVPIRRGDEVVGTIAAISFQDSVSRVIRDPKTNRWVVDSKGIGPDAHHLLIHHANWLGLALETIHQMVEREHQISSLNSALRVAEAPGSHDLSSLEIAVMIVATHYDGLRFHQAMIAECEPLADGGYQLRAHLDRAWGAVDGSSQGDAWTTRNPLDQDINQAIDAASQLCAPIRNAWRGFQTTIPEVPEQPWIIVRHGDETDGDEATTLNRETLGTSAVKRIVAMPGDPLERFLDAFRRRLFPKMASMPEKFRVGVVPIQPGVNQSVRRVLLVTNLSFSAILSGEDRSRMGNVECDPFHWEDVQALSHLARVLNLSYQRDRLAIEQEMIREEFAASSHRIGEPFKWLDYFLEKVQHGSTLDDTDRKSLTYVRQACKSNLELARFVARVDPSATPRIRERHVLVDLFGPVVEAASGYFRQESEKMQFEVEPLPENWPKVKVQGDPELLRSVLHTLLRNSERAIEIRRSTRSAPRHRGVIRLIVEMDRNSPNVWIMVADNGKPFQQDFEVSKLTARQSTWGGQGVGLINAQRVITSHKGLLQLLPAEMNPVANTKGLMAFRLPVDNDGSETQGRDDDGRKGVLI